MTLLIVTPDQPAMLEFSHELVTSYPLDSILVVPPGDQQIQLLGDALAVIREAPFLPLVVATSTGPSGPLCFAIGEHVVEAIGVVMSGDVIADAQRIRAAIRARGCPSKRQLVRLVSRAVGSRVVTPLSKVFYTERLTRREERELLIATGLSPVAWRALYHCLKVLSDVWSTDRSVEALAEAHQVAPKTIWVRCRRLFGMTWRQASAWCAWEGLVGIGIRPSRGGG
jgi:hypothetical protein